MSRHIATLLVVCFLSASWASAQAPEDKYLAVYNLMNDGDALIATQPRVALQKFLEAQTALKALRAAHPGWNEKIVDFRLQDLADKVDSLSKGLPTATPPSPNTPPPPSAPDAGNRSLFSPPQAIPAGPTPQEQIQQLTLQKALLEAKLREALSVQPAAVDPRELTKAQEANRSLQKEMDLLKLQLEQERSKSSGKPADTSVAEANKAALRAAQQQIEEQSTLINALHLQRDQLTKEIATLREKATGGAPSPPVDPALSALPRDAQVSALIVSNKMLKAELILAENRLKEALSGATKPVPAAAEGANDGGQIERLQARLAALEAQKVPYTPEELALFKHGPPKFGPDLQARKKTVEPPPGAGALVEAARRAVDAGRFDEAEKKYQQVLRQDENSVYTLGNLAAVQLDLKKEAEAEKTLKKALSIDPEDPASLYLYGSLKLRQDKVDEALENLSLSAKLQPEMAQTQYYLGRALAQKGQRQAAETALRKAIQMKPGWAEPHYSLAVMYATQQPSYKELAQWHYQRALAGGAPRNPELEKYIEKLATAK